MQLRKGRFGLVTGVVAAAAGMAVFASSAFAGWVVDINVEGAPAMGMATAPTAGKEPKAMKVVMKLEEKKSRVDVEKMSIISGGDDQSVTLLMHEMKVKMTTPIPASKPVKEGEEVKESDKPRATGRKDKISGYDVEEYVLEKPKQKVTFWVTQDSSALKVRDGMEGAFAKQARGKEQFDFKAISGCPIRVIMETPASTETRPNGKTVERPEMKVTATVTSIKEEALGDAVFQAPADYQDMAKMGPAGGMPGGPAGAGSAKPRVAPAPKP